MLLSHLLATIWEQLPPIVQGITLEYILVFLAQPALYALIGTMAARVLAQTGFSKEANGVIAWVVLIVSAVACAWAGHQFISNDLPAVITVVIGAITLLLGSGLSALRPYLLYLDWIETHIFNVVKPQVPARASAKQETTVHPTVTKPEASFRATSTDWNNRPGE